MTDLLPHPLAELFPMLPDAEIALLADDICTNGLNHPIVMFEGKILDGRNRLAACEFGQLDPVFVDYEGNDPLGFVLSENLRRRHLTESQRAMAAAQLVNWEVGINQSTARPANLPVWKAAKLFSVSPRTVSSAVQIRRNGVPSLVAAVKLGTVSVHAAVRAAVRGRAMQQRLAAGISSSSGSLRLLNGQVAADLTFGAIPARLRAAEAEAAFLRGLIEFAVEVDPSRKVGDLFSEAELKKRRGIS